MIFSNEVLFAFFPFDLFHCKEFTLPLSERLLNCACLDSQMPQTFQPSPFLSPILARDIDGFLAETKPTFFPGGTPGHPLSDPFTPGLLYRISPVSVFFFSIRYSAFSPLFFLSLTHFTTFRPFKRNVIPPSPYFPLFCRAPPPFPPPDLFVLSCPLPFCSTFVHLPVYIVFPSLIVDETPLNSSLGVPPPFPHPMTV